MAKLFMDILNFYDMINHNVLGILPISVTATLFELNDRLCLQNKSFLTSLIHLPFANVNPEISLERIHDEFAMW